MLYVTWRISMSKPGFAVRRRVSKSAVSRRLLERRALELDSELPRRFLIRLVWTVVADAGWWGMGVRLACGFGLGDTMVGDFRAVSWAEADASADRTGRDSPIPIPRQTITNHTIIR